MISGAASAILADRQGKPSLPALDLEPPVPPARHAANARFSVLLHDGPDPEAALRGLLAEAGPDTRLIRVGNPLRAPLTIERILIQTGLVEAGLLTDEETDAAMQQLLRRDDPTTLVIEQAETLSPAALQTLARLAAGPASWSAGRAAPLHVIFAGKPGFAGLVLATPDVGPIRDALQHVPGAEPAIHVLPEADDRAPAVPQPPAPFAQPPAPFPQPPAPFAQPGTQADATPDIPSWFQVVTTGTDAAPPAEQEPVPFPDPARLGGWGVFWLLLLLFLVGAGTVLGVAILL